MERWSYHWKKNVNCHNAIFVVTVGAAGDCGAAIDDKVGIMTTIEFLGLKKDPGYIWGKGNSLWDDTSGRW